MSERVNEIAARVEAATPGPWRVAKSREPEGFNPGAIICQSDDAEFEERALAQLNYHFPHAEDAAFIAHARDDVPYLLAALAAAEARAVRCEERCAFIRDTCDLAYHAPDGSRTEVKSMDHLDTLMDAEAEFFASAAARR